MEKKRIRDKLKKDLRSLFRSMEFISNNFLNGKDIDEKRFPSFFNIYQQLGLAWEFLGLQCKHWDGYRRTRNKKEVCKICGKVKGIDDPYYLLIKEGHKRLGARLKPNSKNIFKNKNEAKILDDTIDFYGAKVNVDVHNSYKSKLSGEKHEINIAPERTVTLKESGIECHIDQNLINIRIDGTRKRSARKEYGGFPWEIKRDYLKKFPVIFEFDEKYRFLGLSILR